MGRQGAGSLTTVRFTDGPLDGEVRNVEYIGEHPGRWLDFPATRRNPIPCNAADPAQCTAPHSYRMVRYEMVAPNLAIYAGGGKHLADAG